MTLQGMVRISALGAILLAACALASSVAQGQDVQPGTKAIVFGFSPVVMGVTGLPLTSPPRAYCVRATLTADTLLVDPPIAEAEPLFPQCDRSQVPLVIRPVCQLTYEEHVAWEVKRERPVVFVCEHDGKPVVLLLTKPGYP